ncbi:MAG TPA: acyl-CoA dehydrogenase family protein [Acidimicrobiales bacterium]|nr:acyl-CoA dehydrogenase family protein [Acidimicrobiales bacterium]
MTRTIFQDEHHQFRATARTFLEREAVPHFGRWEEAGIVDRSFFERAGSIGLLGLAVPEEFGGGGTDDFRFNAVVAEEAQRLGVAGVAAGLAVHQDICIPYFVKLADEAQRSRWLPGIASGASVAAIAMTEPGTGSDLASIATTATLDGDEYVVHGSKTFITNGTNADLIITVAKTDPSAGAKGISLLVIEEGMPGFERGRNLEKIGLHSQDTTELFFNGVRVPVENRLGAEGSGFKNLMHNLPQERLSIAVSAVAAARTALEWTLAYCHERTAFGAKIGSFQNSKFVLAECHTEITIAQSFVDNCIVAHNAGCLTSDEAAMAKWWCTELQNRVVDRCLQLHGGYGYMAEYPIARAYGDARVTTIYGGTTEIMKEIIGRSLGF